MHSSLIGKIEKAKRYAREPERVRFSRFELVFQGEHDVYNVSYADGNWRCSCAFFAGWGVCSHTLAMYRLLSPMLPKEAAPAGAAVAAGGV
jgi:hypothetical protein